MRKMLPLALMALVLLAACKKEEKKPPAPPPKPPPPPPTAQELYDKAMEEMKPAFNLLAARNLSGVRGKIESARSSLKAQINGDKADIMLANEMKRRLKATFQAENWPMVLVYCEAVQCFDGETSRVKDYRRTAEAEVYRPAVTVKGFMSDHSSGVITARLEVQLPRTGETHDVNARVGEEFHGMRFDRIIGNNSAIEVTYLKTGKTYTIEGPRRGGG